MLINITDILTDAHKLIEVGGLLLIIVIVYLETATFLGLVLPGGDYLLFTTGLFCGTQYLDFPLWIVLLTVTLAAISGDYSGYYKGKWLGDKLFTKNNSKYFKQEYLTRSKSFYEKYGVWAFVIGRFMPVIRTLVPMLAGASAFHLKRFMIYNVVGGIVWVGSLVSVGYYAGKEYPQVIGYTGYILVGFVVIASAPMLKLLFFPKKENK